MGSTPTESAMIDISKYDEAEKIALKHLVEVHYIWGDKDLPHYVDYSWTSVEILAQMKSRGDCTHAVVYDVS